MGAQAARLLSTRGPIGDPAPPFDVVRELRLEPPPHYDLDLDRVARSHSGVGLAPTSYDGTVLHLGLPGGVRARVHADLRVELSGEADVEVLRCVLDLDADLHELWDLLPWARAIGAGRVLRSPTAWQDLVGTLAATNTSYAMTQRMVRGLVAGTGFPEPHEVARFGEDRVRALGWGYRAPALLGLARHVDGGGADHWPGLADAARSVAQPAASSTTPARATATPTCWRSASRSPSTSTARPTVTTGASVASTATTLTSPCVVATP